MFQQAIGLVPVDLQARRAKAKSNRKPHAAFLEGSSLAPL